VSFPPPPGQTASLWRTGGLNADKLYLAITPWFVKVTKVNKYQVNKVGVKVLCAQRADSHFTRPAFNHAIFKYLKRK
jgi:hypothetical protein